MSKIELHLGDCREVMKDISPNSIDCCVTSPPYDNIRHYKGVGNEWCGAEWREVLSLIYKITKPGGVVVWVVADQTINGSETGTSFRQALFAIEIGFNLHDTMIFKKKNPMPQKSNRYNPSFEYMFVFSKGKPKKFTPLKERKRFKNKSRKYRFYNRDKNDAIENKKVNNKSEYKTRENVWEYSVGGGLSAPIGIGHPATYPVKLAKDHVLSWTKEGDTVIDPFMGSGSTGVACIETNRSFVGIEKVKEYYFTAEKRLQITNKTFEWGLHDESAGVQI